MKTLSVVIITHNEEHNLPRCLSAVSWANEVIVVDSYSQDQTIPIAKSFHAKVLQQKWLGYGQQKRFAMNQATKDWILNIDADEVVSPKLKEAIQKILDHPNPDIHGYDIYRLTNFLGAWMKHCWGNEYKTRLVQRGFGNFDKEIVHEGLKIQGNIGRISAPLYHYAYPHLKQYMRKFHEYAHLYAQQKKDSKKSSWLKILASPLVVFTRMALLKKGLLDGPRGLLLCILSSVHSGYKYYLLRRKQKSK